MADKKILSVNNKDLKASIQSESLSAGLTLKDLAAKQQAKNLEAGLVQKDLSANVVQNLNFEPKATDLALQVDINAFSTITPGYFIRLIDKVLVSDIANEVLISPVELANNLAINDILNYNLNRIINENLNLSDIKYFSVNKYFIESTQLTDINYKQFNKITFENIYLTDTLRLLIQKINVEYVNTNDFVVFLNNKGITDTTQLNDLKYLILSKQVQETFLTNDFQSKDIQIRLVDTVSIADIITTTLLEVIPLSAQESSIITDIISLQNIFNRSFSDMIYPTDDVYGEATIDDEQYVTFNKNLIEILQYQDVFSSIVNYNRNISDSTTLSEILNKIISTVIVENTNITETILISVDYQRSISDNLLINETLQNSVSKIIQDNFNLSDFYSSSYGKNVSETITSTDSGIIYNQGYVDDGYFVVGYIGTQTTF